MRGLCTEVEPQHGNLHQLLQFHRDLPEPLATGAELQPNQVLVHVRTAAVAVDDIHGAEGTYLTFQRTSPPPCKQEGGRQNTALVGVSRETPYIPGVECTNGHTANALPFVVLPNETIASAMEQRK